VILNNDVSSINNLISLPDIFLIDHITGRQVNSLNRRSIYALYSTPICYSGWSL